jgi:Kef-type K+ transport system membrane component KefB
MNDIEVIICLILLFMAVPDLCKKLGRPALIYPVFVLFTAVVLLIGRFAIHLVKLFQTVIEKTTHWRVHFMALLIFVICAAGERLGLAAEKTAFFLGLAMSRARHGGMKLEEYMAPISQRFLIPLFFVSLGLQIDWRMLFTTTALLAVGAAFRILGFRDVVHRRFLHSGGGRRAYLLLSPNLTMVALGAAALLEYKADQPALAVWLLFTGLFISIPAILILPTAPVTRPDVATSPGATTSSC